MVLHLPLATAVDVDNVAHCQESGCNSFTAGQLRGRMSQEWNELSKELSRERMPAIVGQWLGVFLVAWIFLLVKRGAARLLRPPPVERVTGGL